MYLYVSICILWKQFTNTSKHVFFEQIEKDKKIHVHGCKLACLRASCSHARLLVCLACFVCLLACLPPPQALLQGKLEGKGVELPCTRKGSNRGNEAALSPFNFITKSSSLITRWHPHPVKIDVRIKMRRLRCKWNVRASKKKTCIPGPTLCQGLPPLNCHLVPEKDFARGSSRSDTVPALDFAAAATSPAWPALSTVQQDPGPKTYSSLR